jgi:hypothetical protein
VISVRFKLLVAALSVATGACARSEATPISTDADRVPLTMRPVGDSVWELSYRDASGESLLRVRPHLRAVPDSTPFVASTWTLYTVPSSSPDALLGALARAHGNPSSFKLGAPVDSMRLDVALLALARLAMPRARLDALEPVPGSRRSYSLPMTRANST